VVIMSKILIIGGTGYTGGNIAREAVGRGHTVTSFSRSEPELPVDTVDYVHGEGEDASRLVPDHDVVVAALAPRGDTAGRVRGLYEAYAEAAAAAGARLITIGGFSSLRPAPDAPRFAEGDVAEQFRAEALEMDGFREWLATSAPESLDWTFVSPAGSYGAFAPGERTGAYRLGGDVARFDAEGESHISGEDFAIAVVDEIEAAAHPREHISVAY
jgi:putative NADH-flavin reductase